MTLLISPLSYVVSSFSSLFSPLAPCNGCLIGACSICLLQVASYFLPHLISDISSLCSLLSARSSLWRKSSCLPPLFFLLSAPSCSAQTAPRNPAQPSRCARALCSLPSCLTQHLGPQPSHVLSLSARARRRVAGQPHTALAPADGVHAGKLGQLTVSLGLPAAVLLLVCCLSINCVLLPFYCFCTGFPPFVAMKVISPVALQVWVGMAWVLQCCETARDPSTPSPCTSSNRHSAFFLRTNSRTRVLSGGITFCFVVATCKLVAYRGSFPQTRPASSSSWQSVRSLGCG